MTYTLIVNISLEHVFSVREEKRREEKSRGEKRREENRREEKRKKEKGRAEKRRDPKHITFLDISLKQVFQFFGDAGFSILR